MDCLPNFLRSLQQLNDSAWADTLIPRLKNNGSAGSFALACKQLRQLCHGTQDKLRLTGADCSHEATIALIPQHFPSCSEVEFTVEGCEDATRLPSALPAMARLQHLSMLELRLTDSGAGSKYCTPLLLELVRLQLSGLQRLQLSVSASWRDTAWQALGRATQLTSLAVEFDTGVEAAVTLEHLSALSSLSLASLQVIVYDMEPVQQYDFLQHLTGLTSLYLPLDEQHGGLANISSCTRLKDLALVVGGASPFTEAECAALAQLVQLTKLDTTATAGSNPHFLSALGALSQLEYLSIDDLSPTSLPCLASLTNLTGLHGAWQAGGNSTSNTAQLMCSSVVDLGFKGPCPCAAFSNLKVVCQWDAGEPATMTALAENCKQLELLGKCVGFTAASLRSESPIGERSAAIQALASLKHLTVLNFSANDNAELAAVATIKQLKRLYVLVPAGSNCTLGGLLPLIRLQGLQWLTLELRGLSVSQQDAQSVLYGMQHVGVLLVLASSEQLDEFRAALCAARAAQLAVPAAVVFGPLP